MQLISLKTKSGLSYLFWAGIMALVIVVLSMAMFMQYAMGEIPCPLCLLQRACFLGIGFGAMLQFRGWNKYKSMGICLLFVVMLEVISVRQSLLDICPRPGHEWIGTSIFGIYLPLWSVIMAWLMFLSVAFNFLFLGVENRMSLSNFPKIQKLANILGILLMLYCLINFVSVVIQCGLEDCHTFFYRLLQ